MGRKSATGPLNRLFNFKKLPDGSVDKSKVQCSICFKEFNYHRSTTSLSYHLQAKHPGAAADASRPSKTQLRQSTMLECGSRCRPLDESTSKESTTAVARCVATDCRPVNIVEDSGVKDVISLHQKRSTHRRDQTDSELESVSLEEKLPCLKMSKLQTLRASVNQRLTMAAEEIFKLFESTMAEYEEELCQQRKLPDGVFKSEFQLHRADVQQLLVCTEAEPAGQQERSPSLDQKDPAEQPRIKEEPELPTSQEDEQLRGMVESDVALIRVKTEEVDEEKAQSSESYQRLTEEVQSKADAEDCGASEPARNSDPNGHLQSDTDDESPDLSGHRTDDSSDWEEQTEKTKLTPDPKRRRTEASHSDPETDDSCDWEESASPPTGLHPKQVPVSDMECNPAKPTSSSSEVQPGEKAFSCSVCGKQYQWKTSLMVHMRLHSEGKRFRCSVCDKSFQFSIQIVKHMKMHSLEEVFNCSACGFVQTTTSASASRSKRSACPICKVPVTDT